MSNKCITLDNLQTFKNNADAKYQDKLTTTSVNDGTIAKNIGFDSQGNIIKAIPSSGGMTNPMTTQGDLIIGGSSGTPTRLTKGTTGQVLKATANGVEWANESGGGGGTSFVFNNGNDSRNYDINYESQGVSGFVAAGVFNYPINDPHLCMTTNFDAEFLEYAEQKIIFYIYGNNYATNEEITSGSLLDVTSGNVVSSGTLQPHHFYILLSNVTISNND